VTNREYKDLQFRQERGLCYVLYIRVY